MSHLTVHARDPDYLLEMPFHASSGVGVEFATVEIGSATGRVAARLGTQSAALCTDATD